MSFLKIKIDSKEENDFKKSYSNGLDFNSIQSLKDALPSFYTDFLTGTKSVTSFILQELNLNEAKNGRVSISQETVFSTSLILSNIKNGKYQLYYKSQAQLIYDKLFRFKFTDNGINYISEVFTVSR
mgnify:CR=1 FL=1